MLKYVRILFCLGLPVIANANSVFDGVYNCSLKVPLFGQVDGQHFAVIGKEDGTAGFAPLALTGDIPFFVGYGTGNISGTTFTGKTNMNLPFSFSYTQPSPTNIVGKVGTIIRGLSVEVEATCNKIF